MKLINIDESYYWKKIKENLPIIAGSLAIAAFCVLISYPGIFYSDSYVRVELADKLRAAIKMLFSGNRDGIEIRSWLTVIPSLFMAVCKMITGNIATYTFLQAFSFYLVSLLLIKRIAVSYRWLQYLLFLINPLFYSEAIYYEAGVGCVIGIVGMVLLLSNEEKKRTKFDAVMEVLLLMLASFVAFGYRANAFTILPVFVLYIFIQKWTVIKKTVLTGAILLGLLLALAVPKILNVDTMSSSMAGFVWEMLTSISEMEPAKKAEYIDFLDDMGEKGITERAVDANIDIIVSGFLEYSDMNIYTLSKEGNSQLVLKKYLEFMRKEPAALWKTKWKNALRTLGIKEPLSFYEYEYNCVERMSEYGFNDSVERLEFYRKYYAAIKSMGDYILKPWIVFLVSIVLVIYEELRKKANRRIYLLVLSVAFFYYGAYLINTQSFELRYFYPSLYLLWIMDLTIVIERIADAYHSLRSVSMKKRKN